MKRTANGRRRKNVWFVINTAVNTLSGLVIACIIVFQMLRLVT